MKFSEFRQYRPKTNPNVVAFVCEDEFLVEESRSIWAEILGPNWIFERLHAKEFDEIETAKLMECPYDAFRLRAHACLTRASRFLRGRFAPAQRRGCLGARAILERRRPRKTAGKRHGEDQGEEPRRRTRR